MGRPEPMSLGELVRGLGGQLQGNGQGVAVRGVAVDSRRVQPGDLFVAMAGERTRGAAFGGDAVARGAVALVVAPGDERPGGVPALIHPDPGRILARLSARFYRHPARRLTVIGVTGTNGKTTTALMVAGMLRRSGRPAAHWTTTEVAVGGARFRPYWTTPPPADLHRFLWAAVRAGASHVVMEVSSHGVALGRLEGIRFAAGAVTNISADHLDFHGSLSGYIAAKQAFVQQLDAYATAVLNADDPVVAGFRPHLVARVLTFGFGPGADLRAGGIQARPQGLSFGLQLPGASAIQAFDLPVPGHHNVLNATAAVALAGAVGVPVATGREALAAFDPPPRRLETRRIGPFTIVNDVAMNEASCDAVLGTVAALAPTKLVVVHAVRGHRGPQVSRAIAGVFARWEHRLGFGPLVVSLSRTRLATGQVDHRVRAEELDALREQCARADLAIEVHDELEDAIAAATARLPPGGLLLLLGTFGMDDGPAMATQLLARRAAVDPGATPGYLSPSYGLGEDFEGS